MKCDDHAAYRNSILSPRHGTCIHGHKADSNYIICGNRSIQMSYKYILGTEIIKETFVLGFQKRPLKIYSQPCYLRS